MLRGEYTSHELNTRISIFCDKQPSQKKKMNTTHWAEILPPPAEHFWDHVHVCIYGRRPMISTFGEAYCPKSPIPVSASIKLADEEQLLSRHPPSSPIDKDMDANPAYLNRL